PFEIRPPLIRFQAQMSTIPVLHLLRVLALKEHTSNTRYFFHIAIHLFTSTWNFVINQKYYHFSKYPPPRSFLTWVEICLKFLYIKRSFLTGLKPVKKGLNRP